ncbi:hypothetical protein PRIPAC_80108 [Pristionchus pacificus]|uniref:Uncharacterized protein n=1 Tax=Pristionchus pacificus TaxID=54126 RepID=A0A2A6CN55_PRIPA|nr:hypothetical protein PRIPAC_80108 [Pristionchus pacificus]|eukprot:PDM79461.1 hypothetical protein PRIPAC_32040 [Pristionchus pacificus]
MDFYISPELGKHISTGLHTHFVIASILHVTVFYCFLRKTLPNQRSVCDLVVIQCILYFLDILMDILINSTLSHNFIRFVCFVFCVFVFGRIMLWPINLDESDKAMTTSTWNGSKIVVIT